MAKYKAKGKIWVWPGEQGAWHFVHVDKKLSEKIKEKHGAHKRGFGSLRVSATIGKSMWKTSVFPDSHSGTYLLPLKAAVRRAESLSEGDTITFTLDVLT